MKHLEESHIPFDYWTNSAKRLKALLIINPMGLALARAYGHVMFMDCTYKTNRYKMPLLHIVSAAATNQSFTIAYGWLRSETTEQYTKALDVFRTFIGQEKLPTQVVITDLEPALINALEIVFKDWKRLL